ncbi:MAG TPA: hypothetical protein VHG93_22710 [Longimicrobium sp.]|nr:hypothetical protein [Longimicrobium sp.]
MSTMTADDFDRLERYLRDAKRRAMMGEAIAKEDFAEWLRHAAAWLLDKLEDAWRWVRRQLGLV